MQAFVSLLGSLHESDKLTVKILNILNIIYFKFIERTNEQTNENINFNFFYYCDQVSARDRHSFYLSNKAK